MMPSLSDLDRHLAWFVLNAVEQIDLQLFYAKYRGDGIGNSVFDPLMMVALLLYISYRSDPAGGSESIARLMWPTRLSP